MYIGKFVGRMSLSLTKYFLLKLIKFQFLDLHDQSKLCVPIYTPRYHYKCLISMNCLDNPLCSSLMAWCMQNLLLITYWLLITFNLLSFYNWVFCHLYLKALFSQTDKQPTFFFLDLDSHIDRALLIYSKIELYLIYFICNL